MNKEQSDVKEFMLKAGQECPSKPTIPNWETRLLRCKLIAEELVELCDALGVDLSISPLHGIHVLINGDEPNLVEAVDATTDLKVVVIGTDVSMGIDNEPCWNEVHRSNMSKFIDGSRRSDGKWMKGKSWSPPDLKSIIDAQKSVDSSRC